ncbi:MAG: class I SAM-dependent methyltransferase [Syntrophomonas sp.]|nr:class I SAM-dependent methyltransferase [Syntrophomonas sp.]
MHHLLCSGKSLGFLCDVKAIELGKDLAEYAKEKFNKYKKICVLNILFENFQCEANVFDLVYSATAFHWIPEDIGYPKALRILKKNGALALFWNKPFVARDDDLLHQKIQNIYQKYRSTNVKIIENDIERYKKISETIQSYGFRNIEVKLYHQ